MSEAVASPSHRHVAGAALRLLADDRLARRAASGDREAFAVLYRRHHQALYRYCRAILGNGEDAADALQNTMAAALRALPGDSREIRIKPWLYRIAHNESVSLLRRRTPHADLDAAKHLAAPAGFDSETRERLRQLIIDLRDLQDRQRTALVMRELNGLEYEEIAATLETSQAATKQLVYEARSALHEMAEGRDMSCDSVRRSLSADDRRMLRGRKLRSHVKACAGCREFKEMMDVRQQDLAALTPALPAVAAAMLLQGIVGGGGSGGVLAGLASGAAGKVAATSAVAKSVATVAVVATVGAGTAGLTGNLPAPLERKEPTGQSSGADPSVPTPGPRGALGPDRTRRTRTASAGAGRGAAAHTRGAQGPGQGARAPQGARRSRPGVTNPRRSRPTSPSQRADSHKPTPAKPVGGRRAGSNRGDTARPSAPANALPRVPGKGRPAPPARARDTSGQVAIP